jgi:hypothetical protein
MLGCDGAAGSDGGGTLSAGASEEYTALRRSANAVAALDAKGVAAAYPAEFGDLAYDPLSAEYLDRIQASALALPDAEKTLLGKNGFAISKNREFPTFVRGYAELYSEHLPVYISADAILESVHASYDLILANVEVLALAGEVEALLTQMRSRLPVSDATPELRADVDVYLAVAIGLLQGSTPEPVAGGSQATIDKLRRAALAGTGTSTVQLFGASRDEDLSQFMPRGHYADDPRLQQYFRAMTWLGRIDLRLIETKPDGSRVFNREQYLAMLLMRDLIGPDVDTWTRVDDVLRTFVGESDNMIVPQIDQLVADLGGPAAAKAATDDVVTKAIVEGGYGQQQIASYLMVNGTAQTLPLNRSFLVFGQRFTVDSNVLASVVYDRIDGRMMPDPLDAAFAALGNNQALALDPDVSKVSALPGALARARVLVDSHGPAFWESSFYNLWMFALRSLSPPSDRTRVSAGLPAVASTENWGRRILNAQLGSWAELRHDTVLYSKPSYTGIPACGFPDAYVDPYPEVFAALRKYAERGDRIAEIAQGPAPDTAAAIAAYFQALRDASAMLEQMASEELRGEQFSAEELAFVNDAVRIEQQAAGCTSIEVGNGWLARLFFDPMGSIKFDPTIADVHTQPADASGAPVGYVLHVGTGYPRMMVVTVDACGGGLKAYAGVVFAYHEEITSNFERLTDEDWAGRFTGGGARPADVPWLAPVLAP